MGFPVGYSELLLPRILLRLALLLGSLRRLLLAAFDLVGLGDLLDVDRPWPYQDDTAYGGSSIRPQHQLLGIERALPPSGRYEELSAAGAADGCAVCLCEFDGRDEVRRLGHCRHVFHRGCIDRWVIESIEHRSTCPLCRAPLVSSEAPDALDEPSWDSAGGTSSHYHEDDEYCCCYSSLTSPTLVLLRHFPSSSQSNR